jgi:hypothetical protein
MTGWFQRLLFAALPVAGAGASLPPGATAFIERHCASCHDDVERKGGLDLGALRLDPANPGDLARWARIHDRAAAGEMPPQNKARPEPARLASFLRELGESLQAAESARIAAAGRGGARRLNALEYENAVRDLLAAPWLQLRGQFPEDGEAHRFNKAASALDVSHVHLARYLSAADHAFRQVLSVRHALTPATVARHYAREQRTLTGKFSGSIFNSSPDRMTYPLLDLITPQPEVRRLQAPLTAGPADPVLREREAVGWVSSNYPGFTYRWDGFRAPVAGRYRIRFSGHTLWAAPGGIAQRYADEADRKVTPRPPNPNVANYDQLSLGRTVEPITVYTRNGVLNRRVGGFDLTPEPAVHDLGEVWLLANETLVPDASRFYRSRPNNFRNPLMTPEGTPSVAFRWMEVEGPLQDETTLAGYRLLFGDLPLRQARAGESGVAVPVVREASRADGSRNPGQRVEPLGEEKVEIDSADPAADGRRLLTNFVARAYRRPVRPHETEVFIQLFDERRGAGLGFAESLLAAYTAVLASPGFLFTEEAPGPLGDHALATRLALFLWNSPPDERLRGLADTGRVRDSAILRAETERLLADPRAGRFRDAFLDYWLDLRKMEESTPSTTLYNDYYLDDALTEAAVAETRLYFAELLARNHPARLIADANFTYLNERLARHYGLPGVSGIAMRRVELPADSPRGGFLTQASVLKVTANGTTTSPVLRGKWIVERILGIDIAPPPPVAAVEPDIRGAVTIREQLARHREDASCASCHRKMDPPGFALESFDVLGGWRDRYRAVDEGKPALRGRGKNGQPFAFHLALPVDASGELPDGRPFRDIRDFKRLVREDEEALARNFTRQLLLFATGAPAHFSDRPEVERILAETRGDRHGLRSLVHAVVQSRLFREK